MFINLDILDKPFYDFFVRVIIILNVFIKFLAQRQIFRLQLLFGFPPWMRIYPVLNALDLITGRQIYEFLDVCPVVVLFPLVVLHVHDLALSIRAVNRALVNIHALQIVHDNGADALHDAVVLRKFQIFQGYVERFHKIAEFNGVLALRVQEYL